MINNHVTTELLEALDYTFNFIEIWLNLLEVNYGARRVAYNTAMKYVFKQIPTMMMKPFIPKQNGEELMTEFGGVWYKEII